MKYKTLVCMNIAIIGDGKSSANLALGLAAAGHIIWLAGNERAAQFAAGVSTIQITEAETAKDAADVVILTCASSKVREEIYHLDDVRNKIVIDATLPDFQETGYINTLAIIKTISGAADVVKVFHTCGSENLATGAKEDGANMLLAGDSKKAKELAKMIGRDLGYAYCQDLGDTEAVPLLDEMASCYHQLTQRREMANKAGFKIKAGK